MISYSVLLWSAVTMELRLLYILLSAVSLAAAGKHDQYAESSVHIVQLRDTADQKTLYDLAIKEDLDIWQHGVPGRRDAVVMVTPENKEAFLDAIVFNNITHYVHLDNVVKALEEQDQELEAWKRSRTNRMIFQDYPRYAEINAYMESIANQYPNLVTLGNAGKSYEGRDIKYLQISSDNFSNASKPIYFMSATLHAREWVATPVALYSIFRLVENPKPEDSDLLQDIDWIIMPLVNPDGYEFSHTNDRLWRKTRSFNPAVSSQCYGVDGNRNFDNLFGLYGVSQNPCSLTYPGAGPFTEPETRIVRDILLEHVNRIQIFMDIHSFGNYILFSYGEGTLTPNAAQMHLVGSAMGAVMDTLKIPKADYYIVGNSGQVLYYASGSADDYAQSVGVPFTYTLELPGYEYNFQVPPKYQDQINEETWHGIAISARLSRSYYSARINADTNND